MGYSSRGSINNSLITNAHKALKKALFPFYFLFIFIYYYFFFFAIHFLSVKFFPPAVEILSFPFSQEGFSVDTFLTLSR